MKKALINILSGISLAFLGFIVGRCAAPEPEAKTETKTVYKTITVDAPKVPEYEFLKNVIFVPVLPDSTENDTISHFVPSGAPTTSVDSVAGAYVELPIVQKQFRDTVTREEMTVSYDIGVSGYHTSLDYATFSFPSSITNTTTIQKESPRIKFDWGLQGGFGYGLTNGKADIYVGIGCTLHF